MSRQVIKDKKKLTILTAIVLVFAVVVGGNVFTSEPPDFPCSQDPEQVVSIADEQVPMSSTDLGSKTTKKTTTKKVKLKTASKKSYSKNLPTKTKTTTKTTTKTSSKEKVVTKTKTVVKTTTKETYKKASKVKTVKQSVATTVSTTVTKSSVASNTSAKSSDEGQGSNSSVTSASSSSSSGSSSSGSADGNYSVAELAPKVDGRVKDAFEKLGFEIVVKSSVSYAGKYDTKAQTITLKRKDDTVYHELGHFLGFIAGNIDTSDEFKAVYNAEKSKYTGNNKAYVTQNSSEYFAESFRDYTLNPSALKKARPKTYDKIVEALQLINDDRIAKYKAVYAPYWK